MEVYNKVKEVESYLKATDVQIQATTGKYDLIRNGNIIFRGNIFKVDDYCRNNNIYDCRLEDVIALYKRYKQVSGLWGNWLRVYSLPNPCDFNPTCMKFYPHTRNYTIDMPNGKEIYYIEY